MSERVVSDGQFGRIKGALKRLNDWGNTPIHIETPSGRVWKGLYKDDTGAYRGMWEDEGW